MAHGRVPVFSIPHKSQALLCGALYFAQERIIFHPDKLGEDYVFTEGEEVELPVAEGISLNCLWMREPG